MTHAFPIDDGCSVYLDPVEISNSRAAIAANSGGGKTTLARTIIERAVTEMPVIVLDPEGEYFTLRSRAPMLLVGEEGDVPLTVESAESVALGLRANAASAVVDLSSLKPEPQRAYVARFIEGLMSAPRKHWGRMLVVLDEVQRFCPEGGKAPESADAVAYLMSQGRKRGIGGVLITQRFAKVRKDAVAEASTVFVGRTTQPLDIATAATALGVTKADAGVHRRFAPGEWSAVGPALVDADDVVRFCADTPESRGPEAGVAAAPVVSQASVVEQLADAVRASADQEKPITLADAERTIASLRRDLRAAQSATPDADAIKKARQEGIGEGNRQAMLALLGSPHTLRQPIDAFLEPILKAVQGIQNGRVDQLVTDQLTSIQTRLRVHAGDEIPPALELDRTAEEQPASAARPAPSAPRSLGAPASLIRALAWWAAVGVDEPTVVQLAVVAGLSPRASTIRNARTGLKDRGLLIYPDGDGFARLTDKGKRECASADWSIERPTLDEWAERLRRAVGGGVPGKVLEHFLKHPSARESTESLALSVGVSPKASTIRNAITKLRKLGVVSRGQPIRATDLLLPEAIA